MKPFVLLVLAMLCCMVRPSLAQSDSLSAKGEIRGKVSDAQTKKALDYVSVTLELKGVVKAQVLTDDSGFYRCASLIPGKYTIKVTNLGYLNGIVTGVVVIADQITFENIALDKNEGQMLADVVIKSKQPLIRSDGASIKTFSFGEYQPANRNSISNISPGVNSRPGNPPAFKGSRSDGTAYYIDGVRVQGSSSIPPPSNISSDERYGKIIENQFKLTRSEPLSTFSVDVDRASYAIVRRYLNERMLPPEDAVRIEELINYFPYQVENRPSVHPFSVNTEVTTSPWNEHHKLLHIIMKAPDINMEDAPPGNLVFLIDVSGSMEAADKLYLLKDCMRLLTKQLRKQDKITIVVYAGAAGMVLEPTSGDNKQVILESIERLSAGGSTAGGEGIKLAYQTARNNFIEGGNNRIILATDGDFNVGITSIKDLTKLIEEERKSGVFLSVLGFGMDNLRDETMETLADKGNGNYNFIDNLMEGKKVLVNEIGGTLFTVAKDVKIQLEFNPLYVRSYRLIGYENRVLNAEDFNNDKKDAGDIGAGHCVTAIYELITDKGEDIYSIDTLKYQQQWLTKAGEENELLTVKVRYKRPSDSFSNKFEVPVLNSEKEFKQASNEMKFALSVAMFGMKLRNSPFVKGITYKEIIAMSKASKGNDDDGYRAEMIKLIETAQLLASR